MTANSHVIVTGGSSGIGFAVAMQYAQRGARVSLIARRADVLERAALSITNDRPLARVHWEAADVCREEELSTAVRRCEAVMGHCDRLVTSAGVVIPGTFACQPAEKFREQLETNLLGTVHAVRTVFDGMSSRRTGRIIMMSSGAGLIGIYGYSGYCASKFALSGFAEALRQEARKVGIGVSICFPPDTRTPQLEAEIEVRSREAAAVIGTGGIAHPADVARITVAQAERGRFHIYPTKRMAMLGLFKSVVDWPLRLHFDWRMDRLNR